MEDSTRLAYLFNKYYEKTCTQPELNELFGLLQQSRHDEQLRQLIDETWYKGTPLHSQSPQSADRILEYITRQEPPTSKPVPFIRRYRSFLKYAAVLLFVLSLTGTIYYLSTPKPTMQKPALAGVPKPPGDQCITLPDGSKVLLHKDAHIEYDRSFAGAIREVTLTGEAYFDIRHDRRPFIVHTGKIRTTVLGTAFNIDAHDRDLIITVVKGKVKVEDDAGDFSILKRNEQVTVDILHNKIKKVVVDASEAIVWKKPYILLNDVTLKEAATELQARFHTPITLKNPDSENCHVTASFTQGEPLEQIITVLSKINSMEYKKTADGGYELDGEGCK